MEKQLEPSARSVEQACGENVHCTENVTASVSNETPRTERFASIDALRGFNMFFILGGSALVIGICAALGCPKAWIAKQMVHVPWEGFAHHDTIFPLFIFLTGVSWNFSLASQRKRGRSTLGIQLRILSRAAVLFLLGLSYGGILSFSPNFRLMHVLGFIGISWGIAATFSMYIKRTWILLAIAASFLLGHYLLLHFCAAPGASALADNYSLAKNVIAYWDRTIWPKHLGVYGKYPYEPESIFLIPCGAAIAIFGVLAGRLIRCQNGPSPACKSLLLAACASVAVVAACVFEYGLGNPCVKRISTSSYVLYATAWSFAMLALFHYIVDVRGWKRWTVAFDAVGKNSILAYLLLITGVGARIRDYFFSGLCKWTGEWNRAVSGLMLYIVIWAILYYFKRKKVFLKV